MTVKWNLTIDCARPGQLATFWVLALGYVHRPPPEGFASWDEWSKHYGVPEDEWDDGAYLSDPDGVLPNLSFLKVPEGKVAKNRLHVDLPVGGGRHVPFEERWPKVLAAVEELTAAGATVVQQYEINGQPDHFVMADPEGNEFCLV
jgi:catechol 2,3-dioxygenase-like lactoylglutathione lyase family enzyme